ncbi:hypothetical protein LPJ66_004664 [Kickxella alabastrina]|uniref:Uncharacterized protein n=1 Tax=Kickxella alabastrina TaxID=61397 RepID=A0ACC1IKG5_9FUNG|nr:hypothetical protein LPJ66_004664 [Kickxella alabastrina]
MKLSTVCAFAIFSFTAVSASDLYATNRLIQLSKDKQEWLSESQINKLISSDARFRDITDIRDVPENVNQAALLDIPTSLTHQKLVSGLLPRVTKDVPQSVLANLTSFTNRYYNSENGRKSSAWLLSTIQSLVPGINANSFPHRFPQPSIIARIEGTQNPNEIVIISAHQDSINEEDPVAGRAPGADDDGSGTVTILEALRVFAHSGLKSKRSVEFHWYAGEEGGLLGSADVSKTYEGKKVAAVLHFDMTGYPMSSPAVGIVTDYTDSSTNDLLRKIVAAYTDLPTKDIVCGYACSDHASWNARGVRAAVPFECQQVEGNTNIHSPKDSIGTIDFDHLVKFVKIALGFIAEVADAH